MLLRRVSLVLAVLGVLLALWPVPADATRAELDVRSGGQSMAQVQARLADPEQRPWLMRRPLCWPPVLAPLVHLQDSGLRVGCAGPNARSMSLAVVLLGAAAGTALASARRSPTSPAPTPTLPAG